MSNFKINWDALGIATSVACAIHCALLPLVLTSLPLFGIEIIDNLYFEITMIFMAFCIGAFSLYHGWKKHHHSVKPLVVFTIGMALLVLKQLLHQWQLFFLLPAVVFIVAAHIINYKFCRVHNHAHAEDCDH
ncbi:MAG: MerC domain-containing protein [Sphingobacteriia bacterium]|nr:MerC domain-containing protein [Sphingobacteriia bacterium]